ncbi:PH domain-containing protein [Kribbella sp. CA-253562]|uniref:PH domain-containing protein n=1 Tax=Kribbella sp. CA-253562 TaxID=3239942 RepID=UPI003D918DAB
MTFKARKIVLPLAVAVSLLAAMCLLAIFDEFAGLPAVAKWLISGVVVPLSAWRVLRTGVKVSESGITLRNIFRDIHVPWASIKDVRVTDSSGVLGRTELPCIDTPQGEKEILWLAGYTFKGVNNRVASQTEAIRTYWITRQGKGSS